MYEHLDSVAPCVSFNQNTVIEGEESEFISPQMLRRDLRLAREAGVHELWLFGANGLDDQYLAALHDTLPLETLQAGGR